MAHINDPNWAIIDCRFSLGNTKQGRDDYQKSHIAGAVYAHLDDDLSGPIIRGTTGRHPLPSIEETSRIFSKFGIDSDVQVVLYDDVGGALAAGRAWWMLHWLGHEKAAILDGGWQKWLTKEFSIKDGIEKRVEREFIPQSNSDMVVNFKDVELMRKDPTYSVIDARAFERYQGLFEPIDPVAGHVPGAICAPYMENLTPEKTFRNPADLKKYYQEIIGEVPSENVIFYCGSGVTSILNIIGMKHAGLGASRLYAGSWSEWITDPTRPVVN
jgi:thiosulfate/3-mercaptopyruvate sulfurtransferase